MKKALLFAMAALLACTALLAKGPKSNLRLVYWNIQNGMWSDQQNNFDNFVAWVNEYDPDVCVWCEAQEIYCDGTDISRKVEERRLIDEEAWKKLASRYGHEYVFMGGHRDSYPQVITSKYPIEAVERLVGNVGNHPADQRDTVVAHGAGWAKIRVKGKDLNIVTLHTWPQAYSFYCPRDEEARAKSKAEHGGDFFRATEMEYILNHTIANAAKPDKEYWMMMGDFNSRSRVDNYQYKWPEDSPAFACQDAVISNGHYIDVIAERYPGEFQTSTYGQARIDYFYCTAPVDRKIVDARIIYEGWPAAQTKALREDGTPIGNFINPSDHRPILVDFRF